MKFITFKPNRKGYDVIAEGKIVGTIQGRYIRAESKYLDAINAFVQSMR